MGLLVLIGVVFLGACAYLQHPKFGAYPQGERLQVIQRSPQFADGVFRYSYVTPVPANNRGLLAMLFGERPPSADNLRPNAPLPVQKTDLKALDLQHDTVVWLGHSSFFVVFAGQRILIDPVLSSYAAPVSFSTQAFDGTSLYAADDLPDIDVLLITHDHWDHLDHATVTALASKIRRVFVPLGVGAHLEHWGYPPEKIHEADWFGQLALDGGLTLHVVPARHYSGRWLTRNKTLWAGFVLASQKRRIFFSGDSGYGPHFKELARRFGGFDLVSLDMGQYDARWSTIHMTPDEAAQAAVELQAKALLPAHVGRFSIANHAWNEPFERIAAASTNKPYRLATPMIGEPLRLGDEGQVFSRWWNNTTKIAASSTPGASP